MDTVSTNDDRGDGAGNRVPVAGPTRRAPRNLRRDRAGFNIVELMVVMVVMSILLVVAIPNFTEKNARSRVEGSARDLATRMNLTRQRSLMERVPYRLKLDTAGTSYYFERQDNDSTWTRTPDQIYQIEGVHSIDSFIGGSVVADEIHFETRGTIRSTDVPAQIRIISALADTASLSVVRTGRVTVSVYSGD